MVVSELERLQKITQGQEWNEKFVSQAFYSQAEERDSWYQRYRIEFPVPEYHRGGTQASATHTVFISAPIFTFVGWDYTSFFIKEVEVDVPPPSTVLEFSQRWDKSRRIQAIYTGELLDHAYVLTTPDTPVQKADVKYLSQEEKLEIPRLQTSEYTQDNLLPLSGIQHFLFCRRQWALIHIEQQWKENALTAEGISYEKPA